MGSLMGKSVIIMGASSGMGRACARAFSAEGAKLVVGARRKAELDQLVADVWGSGGTAVAMPVDVSKRAEVDAAVERAVKDYGTVDVLVNCAGINIRTRKMTELQPAEWERVLGINLTGAFHCTQAVLPTMRAKGGGVIVHIASISGLWGDFSGAAYQASKHGISGLANATMMEERQNGIRVTVIYPGLCDTPILKNRPVPPPQEQLDVMMKPEDIAQACVFAASLPPRTYCSDLTLMPGALQCNGHPTP